MSENKKYSFTAAYNREWKQGNQDVKPIHYDFTIEPFDYIYENNMGFAEGCVVKYITRWQYKGGVEDLYKAKQYIEMLIEKEEKNGST
tara:strand:- start:112 stop:375 length:264 start_codon:yes stop_codon:yes gene_type:complete